MTSSRKIILVCLGVLILAAPALAQATGGRSAGRDQNSARRGQTKSAEQIRAEKIAQLLAANPRGGEKLEAALAALIVADPAYAATVAAASAQATPAQAEALGNAMGRAEATLATFNPAAANAVAAAIKTTAPDVQAAASEGRREVASSQSNPAGGDSGGKKSDDKPAVLTPTTSGGSGGGASSPAG